MEKMPGKFNHLIFLFTGIICINLYAQSVDDGSNDPGKQVMNTVNSVIKILSDRDLGEEEKKSKSYDIIFAQINMEGMSRRILATSWKDLTSAQRADFQEKFKEILFGSYWSRIKNYRNERVEYITGMIDRNVYATVDTVIITTKVEIPISYRLELIDGKWMAYDFLIESLSLVVNFRTEYRNIIKLHGFEGLMEEMDKEIAKMRG